jgi:hypothetical protein
VHQVPLHNKKSRHRTGHQTSFFEFLNFCIRYGSTTRSCDTRRGTRIFYSFQFIWTVRQVPLHNKQTWHQAEHQNVSSINYFNLFEWCVRCRSITWSRDTRRGTGIFSLLFISIYLRHHASGAAPQQGVAAPDGAPEYFRFFNSCCI